MHLYDLILVVVDDDGRLNMSLVIDERSFMAEERQRPHFTLFPIGEFPVGLAQIARHGTTEGLHVHLDSESQSALHADVVDRQFRVVTRKVKRSVEAN